MKRARGTSRSDRDRHIVELVETASNPQAPAGFLTTAGGEAWLDVCEHAVGASAKDGVLLAVLANLIGDLRACWASGAVPPSAHLSEARRLLELAGMAGPKSRLLVAPAAPKDNPFLANGRHRPRAGATS